MQAPGLEITLQLHEEWFADPSRGKCLALEGKEILGRSFQVKRLHESVLKNTVFTKCDFSGTKLIRATIESYVFNECLMDAIELSDFENIRGEVRVLQDG